MVNAVVDGERIVEAFAAYFTASVAVSSPPPPFSLFSDEMGVRSTSASTDIEIVVVVVVVAVDVVADGEKNIIVICGIR